MTIKARRAEIQLGSRTVEGFMLPDGSYVMSTTQAGECIGSSRQNAANFLNSKAIKSLLSEGYTPQEIKKVEVDSTEQSRGGSRINAIPLDAVSAFWLWQSYRGNKKALSLCMVLLIETLEQRFDSAFGVERSEAERNDRLQQQLEKLESDLGKLGEAFAIDDVLRQENQYFREVFSRLGVDPYALPETDTEST